MQVEISIIIATYNAGKTIKKCIESIIPQLSDQVELLIIDGGSKDETIKIIDAYKDRIAYTISESDRGIYDAWNKGIKASKGRWIGFIGADDVLKPNALNKYIEIIKSTKNINDYDYICAHDEYVNKTGETIKIIGQAPSWSLMKKFMPAAHVGSLHNKINLFNKIGLYDFERFRICADYELLLRKKEKLKYLMVDEIIATMSSGGMSFSIKAIKETYKIRKMHHSVSLIYNCVLFLKDSLFYLTYGIRHGQ